MATYDHIPGLPTLMGGGMNPNPPPDGQNGLKKKKRGATRLSCAECRRLKLRCDRAVPCSSCIKRGCSAICPDGSLTTGKGNRFVLASTQELHEKITQLQTRVRELEDGLRQSHELNSSDAHPLLAEDLLLIKAPMQREGLAHLNGVNGGGSASTDVVESFGSLSISDTGRTSYFGQATSSWYYLTNEANEDERDDTLYRLRELLPDDVLSLSGLFPLAPHIPPSMEMMEDRSAKLRSLLWYLPPPDEAAQLRHLYFEHAAWMYHPVSESQFNEQAYYVFYNPAHSPNTNDPLISHQLALMFMILAIGSLMDLSRPAYNIDAEKYHQLARAALFQTAIFEDPTTNAVQALYLMAFYLFLSERHGTGVGSRWAFMGLAMKLAISMGLHRDAGRWDIDSLEVQRRRELFWEVYSYDFLQSFTLGRPPSFSLAHVDCKKPHTADTGDEMTFHWWKHKFISECMNSVYDQAFGAKMPTYNMVLQLDRKLRGYPVPQLLQIAGFGATETSMNSYSDTVPLILQRHTVLAIRESNLLYMHRGFFARAISDHPEDPLHSPYGSSFIAAYRSAGSLVALVRNIHNQLKELTERMWFLWTHLFSCSIILGSIVTRCPSMTLAPSALTQLDNACELFSKTAKYFRAEKVLNIMLRLQERAHTSLAVFRSTGSPPSRTNSMSEPSTPDDDNDELYTLGGKTRLVPPKEKSLSPQIIDRSPTSLNPIVPLPLRQSDDQHIHPSVIQYLRTFQATPGPSAHPHMGQQIVHQSPKVEFSPSLGQQLQEFAAPSAPWMSDPHMFAGSPEGMLQMDGMHSSFPQYFPVFDYGTGVDVMMSSMPSPIALENDSRSWSPETMQNAWLDLANQMGSV